MSAAVREGIGFEGVMPDVVGTGDGHASAVPLEPLLLLLLLLLLEPFLQSPRSSAPASVMQVAPSGQPTFSHDAAHTRPSPLLR